MTLPQLRPKVPTVVAESRGLLKQKVDQATNTPTSILWSVASFVLVLATADALTSTTIRQALKNFLEDRLGYTAVSASAIQSLWVCACGLFSIVGAVVGDEAWGRFPTIAFASFWYAIAAIILAVSTHPYAVKYHLPAATATFLAALFGGVAVGTGLLGPNLVTFGADQFSTSATTINSATADSASTPSCSRRKLYFTLFFIACNTGASVSFTYLAYLSVNGLGTFIPSAYGYYATFLVCAGLLLVATLLFVCVSSRFVRKPNGQDHLSTSHLLATILGSIKYCHRLIYVVGGFVVFMAAVALNAVTLAVDFSTRPFLTYAAAGATGLGLFCWVVKASRPFYFDYHPNVSNAEIDDIKQLLRLLPFASFLVVWQCVAHQTDANFQSIAQQCDLRLSASTRTAIQIPGAMLGALCTMGVAVGLPLLHYVIFPVVHKCRRVHASSSEHVFGGLLVASSAMLWAAFVEMWRRESGLIDMGDGLGPLVENGSQKPMSNLPWYYVVPSYVVLGVAECLVTIPAYDVFYTTVPVHLRSTAMSINLVMLAMGDNLASVVTLLFAPFIPDDLNGGRMEYMFFALAGLALVNAFVFGLVVMYQMKFGMERHVEMKRRVVVYKLVPT
ncbi:Aste57867_10236 [Aphanomyces stellatus]|uniref:Aste57867_10236 protein n=1 Tax=Aphanomyces stellatus TaxID=120398 RepID=A0A485KQL9_9STRA|nr:hypothetical protein As57867_010197 [Aphanomyces stellatus]VFT87111.1 Aste57867_10236 [Aphanomyces stellatus]